jgi:RND superfamily putative drug exporter
MTALGKFVFRRARLVLVVSLLALISFGVLGLGAFGKLKTGGFQDPGAESTTAQRLTDQRFGGAWDVVLLVHAKTGSVDDTAARAAGRMCRT